MTRALYHLVRADFLERVRRYSFLLTLGFSVYLGYGVYSGQVTLQLDKYRGVDNSAWLGSVSHGRHLVHVARGLLHRQERHPARPPDARRQILATTPISKGFYTLARRSATLRFWR